MAKKKRRLIDTVAVQAAVHAAAIAGRPPADAEQVTQKREGDTLEARSVSERIRTVEDLLRHVEADLQRFEVSASEVSKWEVATSDADGTATVTELHRVWVRLKPKAGPGVVECVAAMIDSAAKTIRRPAIKPHRKREPGPWQVLVIADTHFGKYCWRTGTGDADYDLSIAEKVVGDAGRDLLDKGDAVYRPARRSILLVGDLFHYDTVSGMTTGGTPMAGSLDGRLQKMIAVGSDCILGLIERSAATCPTDVSIVHGNHDETLSFAFQRIMAERFRRDRRTSISERITGRQYLHQGNCLIGLAHGHRAKRRLPQLMALEAADVWGRTTYREIHTGHFHSQAAEWSLPIETVDSVLVRVAPSLGPADDYHASNGWVGARRAMESFFYDPAGGLAGMFCSGPRPERRTA
jgi:predicted phosphodiesterase